MLAVGGSQFLLAAGSAGIEARVAPSSMAPGGGSLTRMAPSGVTRTRTCRPSAGRGSISGRPCSAAAPAHMAIESVVASSVVVDRSLASTSECAYITSLVTRSEARARRLRVPRARARA